MRLGFMERREIRIRGIVQGVGFRPFVYGLARRLNVCGLVRNQAGAVQIEAEADGSTLDAFLGQLTTGAPPLARIETVRWRPAAARGETEFRIESSEEGEAVDVFVSPDVAVCSDCLAELFDPADRRYRYPFLNCTNCGPRLTIITGAPYDRPLTTMAGFEMCANCRREYDDPSDRRFHAQPIACAVCGPRLSLLDAKGHTLDVADPLLAFASAVLNGEIGALKGLGGYHLVCDATSELVVCKLRRRKHRDDKPFAIMVRDAETAAALCNLSRNERELLCSARRPIVLLQKRSVADSPVVRSVAPGNPQLGVMLPYTPLHHLLLEAVGRRPLVMTSANRSDEPIVYRDDEAVERLVGIADLHLTHDRPIHVRCDDSVTRVVAKQELPVRRSRGYAPQPVPLPFNCRQPILAVGGQFKASFAIGKDRQAILSHHLGDLEHFEAYRAFERDIELYEKIFRIDAACLAHDLHPDYASSRYAWQRAAAHQIELISVQHHHAHLASCMSENGLIGPVIGVTMDGTGYGTDGAIWGGEVLVGDYHGFRRAAHLNYIGVPGGDIAVRQPWRSALAHLHASGSDFAELNSRIPSRSLRIVRRMLERGLNTPLTSSAGRLFDAIAALVGLRDVATFEGQPAVELEWLASEATADGTYPYDIRTAETGSPGRDPAGTDDTLIIDSRPLIRAVVADVRQGVDRRRIARRFHSTFAAMIVTVCERLRLQTEWNRVVLSGGVFMNVLLSSEVSSLLENRGFEVYRHRLVPPGDGGLSLGQLAVAAARLASTN
jgi:hydrogenase maturation protein HypF